MNIEDYINWLQFDRRLSPHTVRAYREDISSFLNFIRDHWNQDVALTQLHELTIADIRAWLAARHLKGTSTRSNARAIAALRSFAHYCEKFHDIAIKSIALLRRPRLAALLPRPLEQHQLNDIFELQGQDDRQRWTAARDHAILFLLYGAGLRLGEALALTADIRISDSLRVMGKRRKERIVPLLPVVQEQLKTYMSLCPFPLTSGSPLFRGIKGNVLNPGHIQKLVRQLRMQLNLPNHVTPHALRHSFASHILETSDDLRSLQELLGHASLATTQNYAMVTDTKLRKIYNEAHPRNQTTKKN